MNYYKCFIEVDGWGACYEETVQYMWAKDEAEAKQIYCTENNFRKNKKGLRIELSDYHRGKVISKTCPETVTETEYDICAVNHLITYDVVKNITRYYCPTCNKEVKYKQPYCKNCGTELIY